MQNETHTNATAADFIRQAIEAAGSDVAKSSEYDVDGIARYLRELTGTWDMTKVGSDTFWAAVERHAKDGHFCGEAGSDSAGFEEMY